MSFLAGLPGFKELVDESYRLNGSTLSDTEREAFERGQLDATLALLERRLKGQHLTSDEHWRSPESEARWLVTTNFDHLFHVEAAKGTGQAIHAYASPMLPIPKNSR